MKNIITLAIDGMHCAACSSRIERVLSQKDFVESVAVNLATHTAQIVVVDGADGKEYSESSKRGEGADTKGTKVAGLPNTSSQKSAQDSPQPLFNKAVVLPELISVIETLGFSAKEVGAPSAVLDLAIEGMHCAACSSRIEKVLSQKEGIAGVSVNLGSHTAQVRFADASSSSLLAQEVLATIGSLGFSATVMEQVGEDFLSDAASRWNEREQAQLHELAERKKDLIPAFLFALPLLILSMGEMAGMTLPAFISPVHNPSHFAILQLLLCLPVIWSGRRFYTQGFPALLRKAPTMDTLVAMGTGAAFMYSLWNTFVLTMPAAAQERLAFTPLHGGKSYGPVWDMLLGTGHAMHGVELYYESAAVVIALVSLGKYFESRSTMRTSEAMKGLLNLAPETAFRLTGVEPRQFLEGLHQPSGFQPDVSQGEEIPLSRVQKNDILLVRPGGRIPVDGVVLHGNSLVDESMLTGESMPVDKAAGDELAAGTINQHGMLVLQAEKIGADTVLARIVKLVQDAQGSKAPIAAIADRVSLYFVPVVIGVALVAGLFWWQYSGSAAFGLRIMVSVLVIACPCAMGLATPISIMAGTGRGAQLGLLFKNGQALENMSRVTTVVFDKTGTLTEGHPAVTEVVILPAGKENSLDESMVVRLAASLESLSEHALAKAVVDKAKSFGESMKLLPVQGFTAIPGKGVKGSITLNGQEFVIGIGNKAFALEQTTDVLFEDTSLDGALDDALLPFAQEGKTPVIMTVNNRPSALLVSADPLREESPRVIASLRERSIASIMLTGDAKAAAEAIALKAGIDEVHAGVLPQGKERVIVELTQKGQVVAMVGDGINDAPALARADVGIAMGSGIDVAVETGDVVLMRPGLSSLVEALGLSKATMRNIRQNLFWAFAFNVVGIPFAAGIFYLWGGPVLSPMLAGTAMAMSSVTVVSNALRLRFFTPQGME